ncbi:hypothetical protein BDW75DRAFT_214797 [Aspergillus navahoensis]
MTTTSEAAHGPIAAASGAHLVACSLILRKEDLLFASVLIFAFPGYLAIALIQ